ncbi:uncharacterized protein BYT42DRAFT_574428 [Radiomyces spectabilis]|uniref:uncharacterized protein n=1 Tax=Radiomyces spectabilis TaxID=64574 RepID=UPI0022203B40|nr:uncharacterized protein BYT42DRAFT_574428 [Radiomyces spectabilis]KAI8376390.1 hypothetical protein BYT42DRAFT_574428 [Radiomyces spectabilis]
MLPPPSALLVPSYSHPSDTPPHPNQLDDRTTSMYVLPPPSTLPGYHLPPPPPPPPSSSAYYYAYPSPTVTDNRQTVENNHSHQPYQYAYYPPQRPRYSSSKYPYYNNPMDVDGIQSNNRVIDATKNPDRSIRPSTPPSTHLSAHPSSSSLEGNPQPYSRSTDKLPSRTEDPSVSAAAATLASFASTASAAKPTSLSVSCDDTDDMCAGYGDLMCDRCGTTFKHAACLKRHCWEHVDGWKDIQHRLGLSKKQQVQVLEAAQILMNIAECQMHVTVH